MLNAGKVSQMTTIFGNKTNKDFYKWWDAWRDVSFSLSMVKVMCKQAFIAGKVSESEDVVILRKQLEESYRALDRLIRSLSDVQMKAYKEMGDLTTFLQEIEKQYAEGKL